MAGKLIYRAKATGNSIRWNGKSMQGQALEAGVYEVTKTAHQQKISIGKLVVAEK